MTGEDAIPAAAESGGRPQTLLRSTLEALADTRFRDVRWVAQTGSTNHDAMALARQGEREGIVCVADHQSSGRGRRDRVWDAAPGSALLASVLLRPAAEHAPLVTLAMGVAAVDGVHAACGVRARLKWPNDLVVETLADGDPVGGGAAVESPGVVDPADRKLAGILAEADWPAGSEAAGGWAPPRPSDLVTVVVGIGLNVCWRPAPPPELASSAVSLEDLCGHSVDRESLLVALLVQLEQGYTALIDGGRGALLDAWRERSATLGRRVRVDLGHHDIEGVATDITDSGNLIVEASGERHVLAVGDVVHLRAL